MPDSDAYAVIDSPGPTNDNERECMVGSSSDSSTSDHEMQSTTAARAHLQDAGEARPGKGGCCAEDTVLTIFRRRIPWLIGLMLVQSVSSFILQRHQKLIEENIVIASFLTMLVGGGGNAAGQCVADLVRKIAEGKEAGSVFRQTGKECLVGLMLALVLGVCAFPRVLYFSDATQIESLAIALSYTAIVLAAVALGALVTFALHALATRCNLDSSFVAVGAAPTVMVIVDVLGILLVCNICEAMLK